LVELLVALTGGLFVSIAVFALARDASRFYQREGRLASATLAGLVGFERLRADIARAGYMSSPNIQADPAVCTRLTSPAMLANLASALIVDVGSTSDPANPALSANGLSPDSILLAGSYGSPDEFPVRTIVPTGSNTVTVFLQAASGPMARLGYTAAANQAEREALLESVFAEDRVLRIVDNEGRQHYGVISSVSVDPTGQQPSIVLSNAAAIPFRAAGSQLCGLKGLETGATVNVVNFIRYDIRSLAGDTNYAPLYGGSAYGPDANRTELVRTEVDANGDELESELVAEYAVDLQFEATAVTNAPSADPVVGLVTAGDTQFAALTGAPTSAGSRPQDVRAIRARLSVRSREGDRETPISTGVPAGSLYRMGLGSDGGAPYARVRTLQADIMLNNHSGVQW
jgi:hypothetical protein